MSAWMFLGVAILFEVFGTVLLKLSDGFEKLGYGMAAIACYSCARLEGHSSRRGLCHLVWPRDIIHNVYRASFF